MPDWHAYVRARLRPLPLDGARQAEIVEELAQQLEQAHQDALLRGESAAAALHAAHQEVPDWPALARAIAAAEAPAGLPLPLPESRWRLLDELVQDGRYGLRTLARTPGFTLLSALTLALGIGAATAMFSVVNAALLRPLPYSRPEHLVRAWVSWAHYPQGSVSEPEFHEWRAQARTLVGIAAHTTRSGANLILPGGEPEPVDVALATSNVFDVLGVPAALGRGFLEGEDAPGKNGVVVLSHGLWRRLFASDPGVLGRTLTLQGEPVSVVGVMPAGFAYPAADTDLWQPLRLDRLAPRPRGNHYLRVLARVAEPLSVAQAAAEMDQIARAQQAAEPDAYPPGSGFSVRLRPLRDHLVGAIEAPLLLLLGAVGLVLAIACANVASLLLARGAGRGRELAIRSAIGAGRARIARQLLVESLLLSGIGGGLGVLGAHLATPALVALVPAGLPRIAEVRVDALALAVATALCVVCGLGFGLVPVWQATRADAGRFLKSGRSNAPGGARRPQKLLVVAETALALVLLFGAGLLLRSFAALLQQQPGFDPQGVTTASVVLPAASYPRPEAAARFFEQLRLRLAEQPGVAAAAVGSNPPLSGATNDNHVVIEGYTPRGPGDRPDPEYREVSPGYFHTLRIPLVAGREFAPDDDATHSPVAIVSQSLARAYWGTRVPLGQRVRFSDPEAPWLTIVGVAGDVKQTALQDPVLPTLYLPHLQRGYGAMTVFVRGADALPIAPRVIARQVRALDPGQAVSDAGSMFARVEQSLATQRFVLRLLGLFALLALGLAGVGTFGVMRTIVEGRVAEIGVRMALGAGRGQVLAQVLREGLTLSVAGLCCGVLGCLGLARGVGAPAGLFHGVDVTDPLTLGVVALLLLGVAAGACLAPARRATRVDPAIALRGD